MDFSVSRADMYDQGSGQFMLATEKDLDVRKKVSVLQLDAGTRLYFRLQVANKGSEPVRQIVIDNPIPPNTTYIDKSAGGGKGQAEFSLDYGTSWARPEELLEEVVTPTAAGKLQVVNPARYTNIRWYIEEVQPGRMEELYFQVSVNNI